MARWQINIIGTYDGSDTYLYDGSKISGLPTITNVPSLIAGDALLHRDGITEHYYVWDGSSWDGYPDSISASEEIYLSHASIFGYDPPFYIYPTDVEGNDAVSNIALANLTITIYDNAGGFNYTGSLGTIDSKLVYIFAGFIPSTDFDILVSYTDANSNTSSFLIEGVSSTDIPPTGYLLSYPTSSTIAVADYINLKVPIFQFNFQDQFSNNGYDQSTVTITDNSNSLYISSSNILNGSFTAILTGTAIDLTYQPLNMDGEATFENFNESTATAFEQDYTFNVTLLKVLTPEYHAGDYEQLVRINSDDLEISIAILDSTTTTTIFTGIVQYETVDYYENAYKGYAPVLLQDAITHKGDFVGTTLTSITASTDSLCVSQSDDCLILDASLNTVQSLHKPKYYKEISESLPITTSVYGEQEVQYDFQITLVYVPIQDTTIIVTLYDNTDTSIGTYEISSSSVVPIGEDEYTNGYSIEMCNFIDNLDLTAVAVFNINEEVTQTTFIDVSYTKTNLTTSNSNVFREAWVITLRPALCITDNEGLLKRIVGQELILNSSSYKLVENTLKHFRIQFDQKNNAITIADRMSQGILNEQPFNKMFALLWVSYLIAEIEKDIYNLDELEKVNYSTLNERYNIDCIDANIACYKISVKNILKTIDFANKIDYLNTQQELSFFDDVLFVSGGNYLGYNGGYIQYKDE